MKQQYIPDDVKDRFARLQLRLAQLEVQRKRQNEFLAFARHVWPEFIEGPHHRVIARAFERIANGELKRLIIALPPRSGKSELSSYLLPAWMIGRDPNLKIIQATHTAELAQGFGRKVKNLIDSDDYRDVFPGTELATDSKAAGRWNTSKGGTYHALGVGGAMAGKGASLLIIDDPHAEVDALSPDGLKFAYEWYKTGPRQRLQPGGSIVVLATRWGENDLTGNLIRNMVKNPKADQWEVIEFPAILPNGKSYWPEFWSKEELLATKEEIGSLNWAANYMQNPIAGDISILKREWWQVWDKRDAADQPVVPPVTHIIQTYDTAYSSKEQADFSAITTWGIFFPNEDSGPNIILLDAKKGRWDFPQLKRIAREEYEYWEPEDIIIEAKATGTPLAHELRRAGIPVTTFTPTRATGDKYTRGNSVAPVLESGLVWAPGDETSFEPFAEEVIHECAAFPKGENDDYWDCTIMALSRFRKGGFVKVADDAYEEPEPRAHRYAYY